MNQLKEAKQNPDRKMKRKRNPTRIRQKENELTEIIKAHGKEIPLVLQFLIEKYGAW